MQAAYVTAPSFPANAGLTHRQKKSDFHTPSGALPATYIFFISEYKLNTLQYDNLNCKHMRATKRNDKAVVVEVAEDVSSSAGVTLEQALKSFLDYKLKEGKKYKTLKDFGRTVRQFYRWTGSEFGMEADFFARFLILKECREAGVAGGNGIVEESSSGTSSTRDKRIIPCGAFWKWCVAEGLLKKNPAHGFKPKNTPRIPSAPKTDSFKAVMESICNTALKSDAAWHEVRDATVMMIQLASGSRAGDLLSVRYTDIVRRTLNRKAKYSIIIKGENEKTGKTRMLTGLDSPMVVKLLDKCLTMWRTYTNTDSTGKPLPGAETGNFWPANTRVFCSQDGLRLRDSRIISRRIVETAKRLGVHEALNDRRDGGIVGVYDLRRYFATQYVAQQYEKTGAADILALGGMLGQANLNTTRRYIDAVVSQKLIEETSADDLPIASVFGAGAPNESHEPRIRAPRKLRAIA